MGNRALRAADGRGWGGGGGGEKSDDKRAKRIPKRRTFVKVNTSADRFRTRGARR